MIAEFDVDDGSILAKMALYLGWSIELEHKREEKCLYKRLGGLK